MPRFAANLGFLFPEHPFLERFGAARRAGFSGVEFANPYEHAPAEVARVLQEHGLACVLFNLPMGDRAQGDFGIACLPDRVAEFRAGVARAVAYAKALDCPRMNCVAGKAPEGANRDELRATLVANLRYAARELREGGRALVIEPINNIDVPGFFVPRCAFAAELIAEVAEPNFSLQCDLYHAAMEGEDPATTFATFRDLVTHVQFADAPGRGEPGTGKLDFAALFAHLDRLGYGGWTSAEYRPTKRTEATLAWMR